MRFGKGVSGFYFVIPKIGLTLDDTEVTVFKPITTKTATK